MFAGWESRFLKGLRLGTLGIFGMLGMEGMLGILGFHHSAWTVGANAKEEIRLKASSRGSFAADTPGILGGNEVTRGIRRKNGQARPEQLVVFSLPAMFLA